MGDQQSDPARRQALESVSRTGRSADRARFWAGLNRYLAAEVEHERKVAREELGDDADREARGS